MLLSGGFIVGGIFIASVKVYFAQNFDQNKENKLVSTLLEDTSRHKEQVMTSDEQSEFNEQHLETEEAQQIVDKAELTPQGG